jgi:biotin carboxyl carrier protein
MSDDADALDGYIRDELPEIIRLLQGSRVTELILQSDSAELMLTRSLSGEIATTMSIGESDDASSLEPRADPHIRLVTAPTVGVFYHSEQPEQAALVEPGSHVERGSLIGVIEALQVRTEVESDVAGTVIQVIAADGQPVEYGQPLVEVRVES